MANIITTAALVLQYLKFRTKIRINIEEVAH